MKKLSISISAAIALGISGAAIASPGLYVGVQGGYHNVDMEESYADAVGKDAINFSSSGLAGGVFAGATFNVTPEFYLAPEVNIGYSTADGGDTYNSVFGYSETYEIEAKQTYGISGLAGYQVTDATSVYGRLGYQWTKFEASYSETGMPSMSESKTFGGVRVGVGMETAVADNLALRLDWSYTDYSSESFDDDFGGTTTFDPEESLLQVGLSYRF